MRLAHSSCFRRWLRLTAIGTILPFVPALPIRGQTPADTATSHAIRNGRQATAAFVDSNRIMHAWLQRRDPVTGLLPTRGNDPAWSVANSAADLYPFMVLAAWFTEPALYHGAMLEILRQETLLTTRVGRLSDSVHPGGRGWVHAKPDLDRIIFGSSEYMKDGLVPVTELLGDTPWYHRMRGIAADVVRHAPHASPHGRLPSPDAEPNGNMLQVLCRLYWKTGDDDYLRQILAIADFYFLEVLPANQHLPAHRWDIARGQPLDPRFVLSDHGNEIVGGLSEAYLLTRHKRPGKAGQYERPFVAMIDQLLKLGRNADGVWHHAIDLRTGEPVKGRTGNHYHAHCWGYMYTGVYTAYLATGEARFREAVVQAVDAVARKPTYLFDEHPPVASWRANAYSDAIESALLLLNRIPHAELERQIDVATRKMLEVIRPDGIVEDWYGDGNTIRTALMYALWKTQGARLAPWEARVHLGAVRQGGQLLMTLVADTAWKGTVHFDQPRHRVHFQLPVNYPRLNEWPEWFTVEHDRRDEVQVSGKPAVTRIGAELIHGLAVSVAAGQTLSITVRDGGGVPFGK
jgi:hypothetical protein